jgi:kynureninase
MANGLIRSWNDAGWIDLPAAVGARLAGLLGAAPDEIIVCDSVSVNLFKLAAAAMKLADTKTIIVEASEFPTDQYVMEGLAGIAGATLKRVGEDQGAETLARERAVLVKSAGLLQKALANAAKLLEKRAR